ncbi:double-stranded DNA binding protein [Vibrio phage vB_VmeM-32]|nr:double-stranded DNA binding protein [Vibrio phage vB_VmeM-32]
MLDDQNKPQFNVSIDSKTILGFLEEGSLVLTMIEAERDKLKDIKKTAKEKLGLSPKQFGKLLQIHHKRNRDEVEAETDELIEIYDSITKGVSSDVGE